MRPQAVVHVDLDGATDIHRSRGWAYPYANDPLFESGMRNFLDLFDQEGIRATLFVIAKSMEDPRKREWLQEAVRRGHEIASHTISHAYLPELDTKGKRTEIGESRSMLEDGLGVRVSGFRAPGYRIDRESIELLAECGYKYDASAFPTPETARLMKTSVSSLRAIHRPMSDTDFLSWPMPDYHPLPFPFNPSYSLLLGHWYFKWGVGRFRRTGQPLALLFHLVDASDPLPHDRLQGARSRVFTLSFLGAQHKLERCRMMLRHVRDNYVMTTTDEVLRGWRMAEVSRG
jgi:hypothetical protein